MSINLDDLFGYMDLGDAGLSEEEIAKACLDPMWAEAEARFKEEAAKLADLLRGRFETRVKENNGSLAGVEAIDITGLAKEEINARRSALPQMEVRRKTLEELLEAQKRELGEAHGRQERLRGTFQALQTQLKNTPMETKWIDRKELAKRGAELCNQRASETAKKESSLSTVERKGVQEAIEAEKRKSEEAVKKNAEDQKVLKKLSGETKGYLLTAQEADKKFIEKIRTQYGDASKR